MSALHPTASADGVLPGQDPERQAPGWLVTGLDHARHALPAQGPIGVFVHHNTLHALQHLPFAQAVEEAADQYGTTAWLPLAKLQQALQDGRITAQSIGVAIGDEALERAAAQLPPLLPALNWPLGLDADSWLQATLLLDPTPPEGLAWLLGQGLTAHWRSDLPPELAKRQRRTSPLALWQACLARAERGTSAALRPAATGPTSLLAHRQRRGAADLLAESSEALLIRWAAAFLDQGAAWWPMQARQQGFLPAVLQQWQQAGLPLHPALAGLPALAAQATALGGTAQATLALALGRWQIPQAEWPAAIVALARVLPGWAGMFARLEERPAEASRGGEPKLEDFLAALALAELAAGQATAQPAAEPARQPAEADPTLAATWRLWSLAQVLACQHGLTVAEINGLDDAGWQVLQQASGALQHRDQERLLHRALEAHHRHVWLDGLADHRSLGGYPEPAAPQFAVLACFDEREESFRRHLEAASTVIRTYGLPGFFGVAMDFVPLGATAGQFLCPIAVTPQHEVREVAADTRVSHRNRRNRAHWRRWTYLAGRHNRSATVGSLFSALGGLWTSVPLLVRVLAPQFADRVARRRRALLAPPPKTVLQWEASGEKNPTTGRQVGFSAAERAQRVAVMLQNCGLVRELPRVVLVLAHGASSLNNPHLSAYQCGACGGRPGGYNARIFAQWANDPAVRALLPQYNVVVDSATWFVGALHDTTSEDVTPYDLDAMPAEFKKDWQDLTRVVATAQAHNAHERCRRFGTAPSRLSPAAALAHVRTRSVDWAEARPEYGHSSNAVCIVGRRRWTRNLYLDRRAFVIAYDPTIDPAGNILERILAAAGPVGAGINLEYWFSAVDNERYGAGTKLPHNVVSLLGVMDGHASDLRTGLTRQMVEIHEPVRLLLVVESTPAQLLAIAGRQAEIAELVGNGWVQLLAMDPDTGQMSRFVAGQFVPYQPHVVDTTPALPAVGKWADWYRNGYKAPGGHLGPAVLHQA